MITSVLGPSLSIPFAGPSTLSAKCEAVLLGLGLASGGQLIWCGVTSPATEKGGTRLGLASGGPLLGFWGVPEAFEMGGVGDGLALVG
ncbi:hypothetical protein VNO80_06564 [Phaseolus coccineus]|uniref:Uncharacterized protein n=1 Tax=Phaseolus coccineus TaxID=3886 RepID=A0AAN9NI82_PHACN